MVPRVWPVSSLMSPSVANFVRRVVGLRRVHDFQQLLRKVGWNSGSQDEPIPHSEWRDIEYFDESWKERIKLMASFVPPRASVMDLGCGRMWLREILPGHPYTGVDYADRGEGCVVADFNAEQFPPIHADVAFVSGCLEYIANPAWFVGEICTHCSTCILSYCGFEQFSDVYERRRLGWVNDLTREKICALFGEFGFRLQTEAKTPSRNSIFVFAKH